MTPGVSDDRSFERQIGCMAGFLQIFDRHQIIAGKRPYAAKRLYPASGSPSPSERSDSSSFVRDTQPPPSPEAYPSSPEKGNVPTRPLPVFDFKDGGKGSWKFKEGPRLSLDSRAVVDGKGKLRPRAPVNQSERDGEKQRRSPSVVAKLMGLDVLPGGEGGKPMELRRSASESRVSRDISLFRFVDPSAFQKAPPPEAADRYRAPEQRNSNASPARGAAAASLQRKSFFDAQDFFPEPKRTGSLYGEIEKRLRMRGIDEPAKDLETLKQVLEALQLKGLLHSNIHHLDHQGNSNSGLPPIVVMKSAGKLARRMSTETPPPRPFKSTPPIRRREAAVVPSTARQRMENERSPRGRVPRSPDRCEPTRPLTPPARRKVENVGTPQRRSPASSPRTSPRRTGPDPLKSPRTRNYSLAVEDDSSSSATVSESSVSNSSHCDFERSRVEDHKAGRTLLERCDKLLNSIAAITSTSPEFTAAEQPSPISVLHASQFLGNDEVSPPPAAEKSSVEFKNEQVEWEDTWSLLSPSEVSGHVEGSGEGDLAYVAEVLRETERQVDVADLFATLEKRYQRVSSAEPEQLHRRLLFDVVVEVVERKREVPAWEAFTNVASLATAASGGMELVQQVWAEVRQIQDEVLPSVGDLNVSTCGAIQKDMVVAGDGGWCSASGAEMSNAVLYIERQVFKDLIAEVIRELAADKPRPPLPRRKLMF